MIHRPRMYLLLTALALCTTLALTASALAQDRHDRDAGGASASIQITFGTNPHWTSVRGTHVREIRERERPDYDIFHCGRAYYVYRDDHWYMCPRPRGEFRLIEAREVPRELYRVPREHWRHLPPEWEHQQGDEHPGKQGRGHAYGHDKQGDRDSH